MAQRYGGEFSPDGNGSKPEVRGFRGQRPARVSAGARFLYLAPLPLLLAGIGEIRQGDPVGMVAELGAFAALMLGAFLLNEGIRAEAAYDARKVARPPAIPRKFFAAVLAGLGVTAAAWSGEQAGGVIGASVMGALAFGTHVLAFGLDPMKRKGLEGASEFETERVALAVDKAEGILREMTGAAARFGDRGLEARVESLAGSAREVFRAVEEDPRDLNRARKFMSVYLMGARDATIKFADIYARDRDADARGKYEALLGDLETSFAAHRVALLEDNRSDLDVEIEVLRDRLQQEGLHAR